MNTGAWKQFVAPAESVAAAPHEAERVRALVAGGEYLAAWEVALGPDIRVLCYRVSIAVSRILDARGFVDWLDAGEKLLGGWDLDKWMRGISAGQVRRLSRKLVNELCAVGAGRMYPVRNPFPITQSQGSDGRAYLPDLAERARAGMGVVWARQELSRRSTDASALWAKWIAQQEDSFAYGLKLAQTEGSH